MKTVRRHVRGIVAVTAVVVGLGVTGAAFGSHLSNVKAQQYMASHPVAGMTATTPAKAGGAAGAAASRVMGGTAGSAGGMLGGATGAKGDGGGGAGGDGALAKAPASQHGSAGQAD